MARFPLPQDMEDFGFWIMEDMKDMEKLYNYIIQEIRIRYDKGIFDMDLLGVDLISLYIQILYSIVVWVHVFLG